MIPGSRVDPKMPHTITSWLLPPYCCYDNNIITIPKSLHLSLCQGVVKFKRANVCEITVEFTYANCHHPRKSCQVRAECSGQTYPSKSGFPSRTRVPLLLSWGQGGLSLKEISAGRHQCPRARGLQVQKQDRDALTGTSPALPWAPSTQLSRPRAPTPS